MFGFSALSGEQAIATKLQREIDFAGELYQDPKRQGDWLLFLPIAPLITVAESRQLQQMAVDVATAIGIRLNTSRTMDLDLVGGPIVRKFSPGSASSPSAIREKLEAIITRLAPAPQPHVEDKARRARPVIWSAHSGSQNRAARAAPPMLFFGEVKTADTFKCTSHPSQEPVKPSVIRSITLAAPSDVGSESVADFMVDSHLPEPTARKRHGITCATWMVIAEDTVWVSWKSNLTALAVRYRIDVADLELPADAEPEPAATPEPAPARATPSPSNLPMLHFLNRILSDRGFRCGFLKKGKVQKFFRTNQVLADWLQGVSATADAYHCNATFPVAGSRKRNEGCRYKAVWVDVDIKPFEAALTLLKEFCSTSEIPRPSIIVASGGGLHAYWVFTRDLSLGEWERVSQALNKFCTAHGLGHDSKCTIDAVRILRPPETLNHKYDPPVAVEGIETGVADYEYEKFVQDLETPVGKSTGLPNGDSRMPGRGNSHDGFDDPKCPYDGPPANAELIADGCANMRYFKETGCPEEGEEPLWKACLGVMAFAENGDAIAHEMERQRRAL